MNGKFNENLRKARIEKKLTQQRVADLLGVAKSTFTNSEKRMFWRGIVERIEYGNNKRFTVRFVR